MGIGRENLNSRRKVPVTCRGSSENKGGEGRKEKFRQQDPALWLGPQEFPQDRESIRRGGREEKAALKDLHTSHSVL